MTLDGRHLAPELEGVGAGVVGRIFAQDKDAVVAGPLEHERPGIGSIETISEQKGVFGAKQFPEKPACRAVPVIEEHGLTGDGGEGVFVDLADKLENAGARLRNVPDHTVSYGNPKRLVRDRLRGAERDVVHGGRVHPFTDMHTHPEQTGHFDPNLFLSRAAAVILPPEHLCARGIERSHHRARLLGVDDEEAEEIDRRGAARRGLDEAEFDLDGRGGIDRGIGIDVGRRDRHELVRPIGGHLRIAAHGLEENSFPRELVADDRSRRQFLERDQVLPGSGGAIERRLGHDHRPVYRGLPCKLETAGPDCIGGKQQCDRIQPLLLERHHPISVCEAAVSGRPDEHRTDGQVETIVAADTESDVDGRCVGIEIQIA